MGIEYILTPDGELYHWGIKGMKWGQRRYQNKDGSLTPAGKKRYAKDEAELKEREKTIKNREREAARRAKMDAKRADLDAREAALNGSSGKKTAPAKDSGKAKPKSIKDMSDTELNDAIQRARLEDTYRQLRPEPVAKPSFGKQLVEDAIKPAMVSSGKKALEAVIDKTVKDLLKDKIDPNSLEALKKTYEKLDYKRKIDKLKKGEDPNEKPLSWEDKLKKQTWEKNERERAEKEAAEKAKSEAAEKAKADAKESADRQHAYYAYKANVKDEANRRAAERTAKEEQTNSEAKVKQDAYYDRKHEAQNKNDSLNRRVQQELDSSITYAPGMKTIGDRMIENMKEDPTTKRGKEAFKKLNDKIDWDEYLWDDDI